MKCCRQCRTKPWPYVIVIFISTFITFITWMTMGVIGIEQQMNIWLSAATFIFAAGLLLSYMLVCLTRHCAEDQHEH